MIAARVVAENDGWSIMIPGIPVAVDGATLADAVEEMVEALRTYAEEWSDHLQLASNHGESWDLVRIIGLSSDEQLRIWLLG
jgi:hypothetical protein